MIIIINVVLLNDSVHCGGGGGGGGRWLPMQPEACIPSPQRDGKATEKLSGDS